MRNIDGVLWRADQDPDTYEGLRLPADDSTRRDAADLPLEEIANGLVAVLQSNLAMDADDLVRETGHLFGFARIGARVSERIHQAINLAVARGAVIRRGATILLP